ncbi:NDP-sugar synthase [Candidatus Bathyarchaeota archaeon]|nr:NDP-sugar synthase [Candidatus Bathyarchaeota archaeon]
MLQWIFERLAKNNVKETVLAVNQLTEFYIKQNRIPKSGLKVWYSHDPPKKPLGTAGPVKHAERFLGHEPFLVLNGDIFADINYKELMEKHMKTGALATLSLCQVEDPSRYGVAEITKSGRITRFTEKPPKGTEPSNLINAGVYVLNPEVLPLIPASRAVSMEREIFPKLAAHGELFGHVVHGLWMDIGKPEEYLQINRVILDTLTAKRERKRISRFELNAPIALDKGVSVADGAVIGPYAVLGKNVIVGKNVHIRDSVIFSGTKIGNSAWINGAIIGEEAIIGDRVKFGKGCIIADHAKITKGVSLDDGVAVCPAKVVS